MRLRVLALALFSSSILVAQSFTPVRELKNLSPGALEKLHVLETLNALPGGDWRFHAGDLPHGESPSLDDSAWTLVPAPTGRTTRSKAPKEAVWYRRTIEVPKTLNGYDISGSRIWFQFQADANGPMPQIIYFNGRRVALGDDLEPIVLFEPARPGDKVLVAVKLLHTVDTKTFTGVNLRIEPLDHTTNLSSPQDLASTNLSSPPDLASTHLSSPPDPASTNLSSRPERSAVERPASGITTNPGARHLASDTWDSTTRPNPNDLRTECIVAANLLPTLPTPRTDLLPTVESAIAAIDLTALAAGNQQAFDASLLKAEDLLAPLHAVLAQDKIDLAGNSHIDAAWLWPRSETIDVVKRTFTSALQLMNEYPDYTFTQSAAQYSEWIADKYPELNDQIKQRVKEGRWQIVGGMWVEPDLNIPDGESLVRQLLVGQRFFQQQYGVTARIGWNPDSFGYNWQLPQIYKRSGLDYFVTQKMHWNDTNTLPFRLFWWQSPDGSKVLTYFPTDYAWTNLNPTRLAADMAESQQRNPGLTEHLDLFGVGDHGGGPTRDMLDQANHWIALSSRATNALSGAATNALSGAAKNALPGAATNKDAVILSAAKDLSSSPGPSTELSSRTERSAVERPASGTTSTATTPPAAIPTLRYSTPQQFFDNVQPHLNPTSPIWNYDTIAKGYTPPQPTHPGDIGIPTWNDELYFEYHRGIYTSQAAHKRNIRTSETATLDAEKLASLAWLDGAPYPADTLTENWKKITFNQFHDLAAGSGIAVIYRDAQKDFTEVANADQLISEAASAVIANNINTVSAALPESVPVVITNPLAWGRTEVVKVDVRYPGPVDGVQVLNPQRTARIPSQTLRRSGDTFTLLVRASDIPALGYKTVFVTNQDAGVNSASSQADLKHKPVANSRRDDLRTTLGSGLSLEETPENLKLKASSNSGALGFNIDKKTGCLQNLTTGDWVSSSFLAPNTCANQLQTYADNPKQYDAWNIDPGTLDGKMTPIDQVDSIKIVTDGPLRKTIEIKRTFNKSHITQDISLDADADFIRVDTTVDWHETHTLLKAAFPLAHAGPKATFEIPYGAIERSTTRNNSWERAQFEVPALRWADLGDATQGVSILNDSKYGYDAVGNTLRLTLLRSPTWPDPDADQGPQHFTYEIYPHTGPWQTAQTVHRGYELNTPLTAQQVSPHTGTLPPTHSFASIDEPNIILTAVKKAEDANALIFRFYEATGGAGKTTNTHLHVPPGALYAIETNLMENPIPNATHLPITNDTITLPTNPWEIRTLEVVYPTPQK